MPPDLRNIEMDKCTASFAIRIPEILKADMDKLDAGQKKELNLRILVEMARCVHEYNFNPCQYLKTHDGIEQE